MDGQMLRYFAGGNTSKGFYDLLETNLKGLERVFIVSGKSMAEKSHLMEKLAEEWLGKGYPLELIHRADHPEALEGLLIRKLGVGIVDGDAPRQIDKDIMGSHWESIDLDIGLQKAVLENETGQMGALLQKEEAARHKAYEAYAKALKIHDEWEQIYIGRMEFNKADQVAKDLIKKLFAVESQEPGFDIKRRFLGAATPEGPVDFVDNITAGLSKRYFIKGRAGTGKSTLLKKLVSKAEEGGFQVEVYHCGFDPGSLDMVVVRELGWSIFDSTSPHEYFPTRTGDEILDMYELSVTPGTDELFAEEIAAVEKRYREQMTLGKAYLAEMKEHRDQVERLYKSVSDRDVIEEIFSSVNSEIMLLENTEGTT